MNKIEPEVLRNQVSPEPGERRAGEGSVYEESRLISTEVELNDY